jgi:uncharacterized protein DUF4365
MATNKARQWYFEKRAEAFVCSLFAGRDVAVRGRGQQDFGVDFLLDLRKGHRELGRYLAVQVLAFGDFPAEADLRQEIASRYSLKRREEFLFPLIVFAVQVNEPAAVYAWVLEPFVEQEEATLRSPEEDDEWKKLDDSSMEEILARVEAFWDALVKRVKAANKNL